MTQISELGQHDPSLDAPDVAPLVDGSKLVFIGGLHRSGTSLVHRCLSDHKDVSAFYGTGVPEDEGQHLQSVYRPAGAFGGAGRFGFHPEAPMDEHSPLVSTHSAEKLLREWGKHWDLRRQILVEKSPPNLIRTRFLQALFPKCRFIIILRHPIAVSYATQKWTRSILQRLNPRTALHALLAHWLTCSERLEADRGFLRNLFVLRYEEFVAKPQLSMDALFDFLGVDTVPLSRKVRPDLNERYFEIWERRRRQLLTRPYTNLVIRRFEDRVRRFGYSLRKYRSIDVSGNA